jgi:hypothetical protein
MHPAARRYKRYAGIHPAGQQVTVVRSVVRFGLSASDGLR